MKYIKEVEINLPREKVIELLSLVGSKIGLISFDHMDVNMDKKAPIKIGKYFS